MTASQALRSCSRVCIHLPRAKGAPAPLPTALTQLPARRGRWHPPAQALTLQMVSICPEARATLAQPHPAPSSGPNQCYRLTQLKLHLALSACRGRGQGQLLEEMINISQVMSPLTGGIKEHQAIQSRKATVGFHSICMIQDAFLLSPLIRQDF